MDNRPHLTANRKAVVNICKFFGVVILIGGVVYSEILFLGIVSALFPSGPMAIGAMLGAVTTGASILVLVLAKSTWFRPGTQLAVAWIFTGVEVTILILNDILAYQIHQGGHLDQYMAAWRLFCVAAPVVSVIGWILCFYFDPERAIEHKRMEMEDNQAKSQIDFETKMHHKVLAARYKAADMVGVKLEEKIETQLNYHLEKAAAKFAAKVASDFIGESVPHTELMGSKPPKQLSGGKVVDADPVQEAASPDTRVDPYGVKKQVDNEKKKKPLVDFSLPKGVSSKMTQKIDTAVADPEEDPIEEEEIEEPDYGEPAKKDLTSMSMDEAWQEIDSKNAEAPVEAPTKKGKGGRKPKNVTRREVLGLENRDD